MTRAEAFDKAWRLGAKEKDFSFVDEIYHADYSSSDVFTDVKGINIPHAYADLRFNPSFDKQTGYFTRSILCLPVLNKQGVISVIR